MEEVGFPEFSAPDDSFRSSKGLSHNQENRRLSQGDGDDRQGFRLSNCQWGINSDLDQSCLDKHWWPVLPAKLRTDDLFKIT